MPKKVERKIQRFYERKGKSPKQARIISYKIMNKEGLLHKRKGKRKR
jgi:hypothetical protein